MAESQVMADQVMSSLQEKWKLVAAFLRVRGLVKHHIDSFNYFINEEIKEIMAANNEIRSKEDDNFVLKITDIRVEKHPTIMEDYHD